MDYNLAALKLLCGQLRDATPDAHATPPAVTLFGILFQRAWLQGVLVSGSDEGRFLLDDGTGVIELVLSGEFQTLDWKIGMYVMVVGLYTTGPAAADLPLIKVHKIVDLSSVPDREAMWYLEVIEASKLFYLPSVD